MHFLNQRSILTNQVVLTIIWTVTSYTYFVNNTFIKYMPGQFEDTYLMVNIVDVLGTLIAALVYTRFDYPKYLFFTYSTIAALGGLALLFLIDEENPSGMAPLFICSNRVGIIGSFTTIFMAHPAFFPT